MFIRTFPWQTVSLPEGTIYKYCIYLLQVVIQHIRSADETQSHASGATKRTMSIGFMSIRYRLDPPGNSHVAMWRVASHQPLTCLGQLVRRPFTKAHILHLSNVDMDIHHGCFKHPLQIKAMIHWPLFRGPIWNPHRSQMFTQYLLYCYLFGFAVRYLLLLLAFLQLSLVLHGQSCDWPFQNLWFHEFLALRAFDCAGNQSLYLYRSSIPFSFVFIYVPWSNLGLYMVICTYWRIVIGTTLLYYLLLLLTRTHT